MSSIAISKHSCPRCKGPLVGRMEFITAVTAGVTDPSRAVVCCNLSKDAKDGADDFLSELHESLLNYWRWVTEGKVKYGGPNGQYFYDSYHNNISWNSEEKVYTFSIQVSDSPDGDTWVEGSFEWSPHEGIKILDKKHTTR